MAQQTRFALFLLMLTLVGCKEEVNTNDIESDILIEARTIVGRNELVAHTEESMPCANYKIRHSIDRKSSRLEIHFKDILIPELCLTAFGPASTIISLGTIPSGNYEVRFFLNGETTRGTLTTQPLALEIESGGNVRLQP
jgi:hypothetical protein